MAVWHADDDHAHGLRRLGRYPRRSTSALATSTSRSRPATRKLHRLLLQAFANNACALINSAAGA